MSRGSQIQRELANRLPILTKFKSYGRVSAKNEEQSATRRLNLASHSGPQSDPGSVVEGVRHREELQVSGDNPSRRLD